MIKSRATPLDKGGLQEVEAETISPQVEIISKAAFLDGKDEIILDYYSQNRQIVQDKNDVSSTFCLKKNGSWTRSDNNSEGIWWLQKENDDQVLIINDRSSKDY